jgi:hypothetical protein
MAQVCAVGARRRRSGKSGASRRFAKFGRMAAGHAQRPSAGRPSCPDTLGIPRYRYLGRTHNGV